MREILFKAKTKMIVRTYNNGKDDGEWVQGYLRCDCGMWLIYQFEYDRADQVAYEVDPSTICQYTGLNDNHDNKIWENDVVIHTYTTYEDDESSYPPIRSEQKKKNYVIKWDNTAVYCGYRYHNGRNIFPFKKGTVINGDDEVIGNIFDNPELLGGNGEDE